VSPPHLVVCISPHGFGHTAQVAPVVNALRTRLPELRLTLRTTVSPQILRARFDGAYAVDPVATDFGMAMASAVEVLVDESARAYTAFHANWGERVANEARALAALQPDLVLCNVPYLPLAGARATGIPAAALCSLNWADIYRSYCGGRPEAARIHAEMLDAYNAARVFIQTEPAMPMTDLVNRVPVGPIARIGKNRRAEIAQRAGLRAHERLVLVAPGGIPMPVDMARWPRVPGTRYVVEAAWHSRHPDAIAIQSLDMPFTDILASSDVFIGKPGYGSFAEAACNGIPMLYVPRGDWPEEPYLVTWLERHGRCRPIARRQFTDGDFATDIDAVLALPRREPVAPTGAEAAATLLAALLERASFM
jgi:hypothetical protein